MTIQTKDISFVVQGPVHKGRMGKHGEGYSTEECLLSIRRNFPGSKIILSTWKGSNVSSHLYDELVLNEDPGELLFADGSSNINRLLTSTQGGLRKVATPFVCKTRTDVYFKNDRLMKFYEKTHNQFPQKHKYFSKPILVHEKLTKNATFIGTHHFHLSDIFLFGCCDDIYRVFNVPHATGESLSAVNGHNEVYLWKTFRDQQAGACLYEDFLACETIIADSRRLGTWTPFDNKYRYAKLLTVSFRDWKLLYKYHEQKKIWCYSLFFLRSLIKRIGLEFTLTKIRGNLEKLRRRRV